MLKKDRNFQHKLKIPHHNYPSCNFVSVWGQRTKELTLLNVALRNRMVLGVQRNKQQLKKGKQAWAEICQAQ